MVIVCDWVIVKVGMLRLWGFGRLELFREILVIFFGEDDFRYGLGRLGWGGEMVKKLGVGFVVRIKGS